MRWRFSRNEGTGEALVGSMTRGIAARYADLVARGELHPDPSQAQAAAKLEGLYQSLDRATSRRFGIPGFRRRRKPVKGFYVWGGVGRGKSMLMDMFFKSAPVERKRRIHFHEFMKDVHARIFTRRRQAPDAGDPIVPVARDLVREIQLLCFDEFQVTNIADASILSRLFGILLDAGQVIVATSNSAPESLYESGLHRDRFLPFIAIIRERLEVLHLDGGADYRLGRMKGRKNLFFPLGEEATRAMQESFVRLTDNRSGAPARISVDPASSRMLEVPCTSMGVARFPFSQLCERPLGAVDYMAIARNYHTVLIENVPVLSRERRNEAARFVVLVDALYEARTRILLSAAAQPGRLYVEGDGSFEFRRTASRLEEMLSADYALK